MPRASRTIVDQRQLLDKVFNILSSMQSAGAGRRHRAWRWRRCCWSVNTIQVAAYSKRREVAVMKLVGASNWFIQAPFVLEAVVAGLIGAILGFVALVVGKVVLLDGRCRRSTTC